MKPKVLTIFGTRPEAIKMAPVVQAFASSRKFESRVAVTAQHRQMLDQVLTLFEIIPDHDLDLMTPSQGLHEITGRMLAELSPVLQSEKPDLVLVHGDTTTTLCASLAAYYLKIPVGHVEAGLRTRNIYSPWPEEVNRRVAGSIAQLHFAPTETARSNLLAESVPDHSVFVTGNTVIDALFQVVSKLDADPRICEALDNYFGLSRERQMILVTGHRRENFGRGLDNLCTAILELSQRPDLTIIFPVHLNPIVKGVIESRLNGFPNIRLVPPQDYLPFVHLLRRADLILTDSGGIQEEAPSLGTPVLVTRDHTERPEAVADGLVHIVGTDIDTIVAKAEYILREGHSGPSGFNSYGDGRAAERIKSIVEESL